MNRSILLFLSPLAIVAATAATADVEIQFSITWDGKPARSDFTVIVNGDKIGYRWRDDRAIIRVSECTSETVIKLDPKDPLYASTQRGCIPEPVHFEPNRIAWRQLMLGETVNPLPYKDEVSAALSAPDALPNLVLDRTMAAHGAIGASGSMRELQFDLLAAVENDDFATAAPLARDAANRVARLGHWELAQSYRLLAADADLRAAGRDPVAENLITRDFRNTTGEVFRHAGPSVEREGYAIVAPPAVDIVKLEGKTVYSPSEDRVGEIYEIIVGANDQVNVVVEIGEFLGLGEKRSVIEFGKITTLRSEEGKIRIYTEHIVE